MGGYHTFEVADESWILTKGACWASEGGVTLGLHRERVWTSLWTGEGLIDYQTRVSGRGRVVLNAPSPVEEVTLKNERLMVEGKLVLARTAGLDYRLRRATTLVQSFFAGEARAAGLRGNRQSVGLLDAVLEPICHADDGTLIRMAARRSR
jgi:uncharacterized protein (AIM24 family)